MQAREYQKENQIPVGGFKTGHKTIELTIFRIFLFYLSLFV